MVGEKRSMEATRRVECKIVTVAEKPLAIGQDVADYLTKYFGASGVADLLSELSKPPRLTTIRVNSLKCSREELIGKLKTELGESKATTGKLWADLIQPHPLLPDIVTLPVIGPTNTEPVDKEIVVGRKCGEAMMRGASAYVPGIAGGSRDIQKDDIVSVLVDCNDAILKAGITNVCKYGGFDAKYRKGSGGKAPKLREGETPGKKKGKEKVDVPEFAFLGLGIAKMSRAELVKADKGVAIEMTSPLYDAPSMNNILQGFLYLQNLPSSVAAHNLGANPGMTVLDMCAAPGGKTTHIATLMGNEGVVHACDRSSVKASRIAEAAKALGLTIVRAHKMDSSKSALPFGSVKEVGDPTTWPLQVKDQRGFPPESFDRILLDPPCSGLGLRPKLEESVTVRELTEHSLYQRLLFDNAMKLLKPNGEMVYSTCTVNPGENEEMIAWALAKYPLELLPPKEGFHLGGPGLTSTGLTEEQRGNVQLFNPAKQPEHIGFFVARLRKTASLDASNEH